MRRPWIKIPRDRTAKTLAKIFLSAARLWRICIAYGGRSRIGVGWLGLEFFCFDSCPSLALLLGPLLAAVICSPVFLVRFPHGYLAALLPVELGGIESARLAAKNLGVMTGRKRTIARLPKATALERRWLHTLRSPAEMIRIEVGQSGKLARASSLAVEVVDLQRGVFFELVSDYLTLISPPVNCDQRIAASPNHPAKMAPF